MRFLSTYCIGLALLYLKTLLPNLGGSENQTPPPMILGFYPYRNYATFWIISQYQFSYNHTKKAVRLDDFAQIPDDQRATKPSQHGRPSDRKTISYLGAQPLGPKKRASTTQEQERIGGWLRNNLCDFGGRQCAIVDLHSID